MHSSISFHTHAPFANHHSKQLPPYTLQPDDQTRFNLTSSQHCLSTSSFQTTVVLFTAWTRRPFCIPNKIKLLNCILLLCYRPGERFSSCKASLTALEVPCLLLTPWLPKCKVQYQTTVFLSIWKSVVRTPKVEFSMFVLFLYLQCVAAKKLNKNNTIINEAEKIC